MLVAGEIDIWSGYVYCLEADMEKKPLLSACKPNWRNLNPS